MTEGEKPEKPKTGTGADKRKKVPAKNLLSKRNLIIVALVAAIGILLLLASFGSLPGIVPGSDLDRPAFEEFNVNKTAIADLLATKFPNAEIEVYPGKFNLVSSQALRQDFLDKAGISDLELTSAEAYNQVLVGKALMAEGWDSTPVGTIVINESTGTHNATMYNVAVIVTKRRTDTSIETIRDVVMIDPQTNNIWLFKGAEENATRVEIF